MPLDFNKIHRLATPTFVNGKWFKPKMSKMELRRVKKLAMIAGVNWQDPPSLQKKEKPIEFAKFKGIAHDKRIEQRIVKTKELAQGQLRQWAESNRTRREKDKAKVPIPYYDFANFFNPVITAPPIPKSDTIALEKHYDKIAKKQAKEKYLATLTQGYVGPTKKLSSEERLAKRRAEREAKKKEKADKQAAKKQPKDDEGGKEGEEGEKGAIKVEGQLEGNKTKETQAREDAEQKAEHLKKGIVEVDGTETKVKEDDVQHGKQEAKPKDPKETKGDRKGLHNKDIKPEKNL